MSLYFAYGSNLSRAAMARRAPGAAPVIAAFLPGHRLTLESNEPRGAPPAYFANVRLHDGSFVPGALYEADAAALAALDAYEDVARGVYVRVVLPVFRADGKRARAVTYRMPVEGPPCAGSPRREQLEQIRRGYADWGLDVRVLDEALARYASARRDGRPNASTRPRMPSTRA